eukprot:TRINITY_DN25396_c0_g1_i3.p1 TRINITY_DN25396_c0_g1~~TRINITY_DN25396_c0_g1_i3.p1  ORF type:complete len:123 (+),score=13.52 TRINITY_DN25396_c0_g1_i3:82-450(+)
MADTGHMVPSVWRLPESGKPIELYVWSTSRGEDLGSTFWVLRWLVEHTWGSPPHDRWLCKKVPTFKSHLEDMGVASYSHLRHSAKSLDGIARRRNDAAGHVMLNPEADYNLSTRGMINVLLR